MLEYRNDPEFRIDYDQVINKIAFPLNRVGHLTVVPILPPTGDLVLDDDNSMAVDGDTGSDSTGDGTAANPFATIVHGMDSTTEVKPYVRVLNSGLYNEDLATFTTRSHFAGLYAEPGETPTIDYKILGFTPSNSNSIFVKKTGSDTTGDGTMENPVLTIEKAITLCDASHQKVGIMDNGKYIEKAFIFTANFLMLFAMLGCCPEVDIIDPKVPDIIDSASRITVTAAGYHGSVIQAPNGNIFYFYSTGSSTGYFMVYDPAYNLIKSATLFYSGSSSISDIILGNTPAGDIIVLFKNNPAVGDNQIYYRVIDSDSYDMQATVSLGASSSVALWSCTYVPANNTMILYYGLGATGLRYYRILNATTWTTVSSGTCGTYVGFTIAGLVPDDTGDYLYSFEYEYRTSPVTGYYPQVVKWTLDMTSVVSTTALDSLFTTNPPYTICVFRSEISGPINLLHLVYTDPVYDTMLTQFDNDLSIIRSDTITSSLSASVIELLNGDWAVSSNNGSVLYLDIYKAETILMSVSTFSLCGVLLTTEESLGVASLKYVIQAAGPLTIQYSTLKGFVSKTSNQSSVVASASSDLHVSNSLFYENESGLYCVSDTVFIKMSMFCFCTMGYAIHIKGTAAALGDIILDQLDIFNNYGGVYAEDWGGTNEIIRNSIFYLNGAYDVFSDDNQITVGYSIMTGAVNSLVAKQNCLAKNPLYINEGAYNPDDLDLNIKMRILGYKADSPAYQLADATPDRNAGSLNVIYVGAMDTWSTIYLPKPVNGFNVGYRLIGADTLEKLEGADSKIDAILEEVQSEYADGLEWENFQKILTLFSVKKSLVKLFPDPVTYPDFHNEYMIDWEKCKLPGSGGHIKFDQRGVKGVILAFIRGYA